MIKHRSYNFFGNLVIVNFPRDVSKSEKKKFAQNLMKKNSAIKTILEKSGNFKGRLRKMKTSWLAGEKTKEVIYNENGCTFKFDVDETYFSPRLSNERKEVASYIKKGENVLVMFAGVAPFPIVIAKNSHARKVCSNELNKKANQYAELNIKLNKVVNKVELIPGDIKKVAEKIKECWETNLPKKIPPPSSRQETLCLPPLETKSKTITYNKKKIPRKFDVIIMPRPQLKDSFLKQAFMLSKKGTRIYYYDFCKEDEMDKIANKIKTEAKRYKKKIKILKIKNAGEIAPYKIRCRIDFKILN